MYNEMSFLVYIILCSCIIQPMLLTEVKWIPKNCEELLIYVDTIDHTTLLIDPDGVNRGVDPFEVECEIKSSKLTGRTIVTPTGNLEEFVNGYENYGSFIHYVTYGMSLTQIVALMTSSTSCRQYMKYECHNSILVPRHGFWVSRDGSTMYNWGSPTGHTGCMCSYNGVCSDPSQICECNRNDNVDRYDDGYIEDMATLPVIRLQLSDTGSAIEYGTSTIGPLECAGITGRLGLMHFYGDICLPNDYVLSKHEVMSHVQCLSACQKNNLCQSISVSIGNTSSGLMMCTLNHQSATEVQNDNLMTNIGCKQYEFIQIKK